MSFCSDLTDKMRTLINPEIKVGGDMDYPEVYIPLNDENNIENIFIKVKDFMFERGYVYQDCGQSNDLQHLICTFKKGLNYKPNTLKINERQLKKLVKESVVKFLKEEMVARHASDRKPWEFTPGDTKFNYMLLSRLQTDCDYFLGNGNRYEKNLWAGNVDDHIEMMKKIWNGFEEKPEWLSMEQIEDYERKMKNNDINNDIDDMKLNESKLRKIINESIQQVLKENKYSNPVTKWIYWCFNYHRPEEFIEAMVGSKEHHLYQHFLSKFNHMCKTYGSDAAMNRFFVELDEKWQQKLLDYVETSYF